MCSLVTKEDYNKGMQSQQSFHVDYVEYARNKNNNILSNKNDSNDFIKSIIVTLLLLKIVIIKNT